MTEQGKLKKIQAIELDILKFVVQVCRENNIQYYLIGGTLLGAVRHGGFIPWDDDIDIAMPREDYEHFIALWPDVPHDGLYLQCREIDIRSPMPFAKVRKDGTEFVEKETKNSSLHKGISIDIFPLDFIPEKDTLFMKMAHTYFVFLSSVNHYKNGYRDYKKVINKIACALFSFLPYSYIARTQHRIMTCYNRKPTPYITSYASGYGYRGHCGKYEEVFGKGVNLPFEDMEFCCPTDFKGYLSHLFGDDYMTLPPPEKRGIQHRVLEVKFGDETNEQI